MAKGIWKVAVRDDPIYTGEYVVSSRKIKMDLVKTTQQKLNSKPKAGRTKKTKGE